jgi:hypothetical protein
VPVEGSEASQILSSLIEQIKYEKGGQGACPVRIIVEGDREGAQTIFDECLVEETQEGSQIIGYQDFLASIHK